MGQSSFHRGNYDRVRRSLTIVMVELEALEPRMQIAYKLGQIPAQVVADLSLARLMAVEMDRLMRHGLDIAISDHYDVYSSTTFDVRRLAGKETE